MANFDAAKNWVILLPSEIPAAKKAAEDLSRCTGLLAGIAGGRSPKAPAIADAAGPAPPERVPVIVLNSDGRGPEYNGFSWRAGPDRVEIRGESGRGLCNGIYNFLAALGISWPVPEKEILPSRLPDNSQGFPLISPGAYEPSRYEGKNPAAPHWRRYVPGGKNAVKYILARREAFAAWAARRRYDALVFPLEAFASRINARKLKELRAYAGEYGIALEAGGRDLSSLVPRKYFFFHRDYFRMEEGRRVKAHHFCPTNPAAIALIGRVAAGLFRAAGETKIFHLWPDKGAETAWCSCPSCRAFTPAEQNRIGVNAAADILAAQSPGAFITYFEKAGTEPPDTDAAARPEASGGKGTIPMRKNLLKMERVPEPKDVRKV